ncbi:MAG TPA: DUF368 domain-containing protein [Bacilli bacterium]|nr:DUF368 domain-containing protein [Bacilli bacterium]
MTKKAFLVLKGFFLGVANLIPGVSGGTVAVVLGIYECIVDAINNIFKDFKNSVSKLLPIIIGVVLSIIAMSKVIVFALENYEMQTVMFFVGLIVGGIPLLLKKIKHTHKPQNMIWFLVTFVGVTVLSIMETSAVPVNFDSVGLPSMIMLVLVGILSAATMVIPGISGSFVLMLVGYYEPILKVLSDITNFSNLGHNLIVIIPFLIGVIIGIILMVRLIKWLIKKYEIKVYHAIIGFIVASIFGLIISLAPFDLTWGKAIVSIITFVWGFFVTQALLKENK